MAGEEVVSVYHCVSPTEDGVVGVTEDGGERALTQSDERCGGNRRSPCSSAGQRGSGDSRLLP